MPKWHAHQWNMSSKVLATLLVALSFSCFAQTFTSSITGVVTDPTGAVVSGASVELENKATNDVRDFKTSGEGSYQFQNLLPGTYRITVRTPGFKTFVRDNLALRAETSATVNVSIEVGGTEEKVSVTASSVLVDTESANNSVTLESQLIEALPNNTRNPLNFVFALAGTTEAQGNMTSRSQTFDQQFSMFGINGGRTGQAQILIDGAPSTAPDWGGLIASPINDSVQEQQVMTNTYDAQYERSGMGVVTLVTKSGTSEFHGQAYDYLRNSALDANYWSNNTYDIPKGQFKRNQFGGNLGGPLLKRFNLYFFAAYEGLRQPDTEASGFLTVPTDLQKNGDFSQTYNADGALKVLYNPFTTTATTDASGNTVYTRQPFAGNKIPQTLWNTAGQKMLSLYPAPNRAGEGPNNQNNYYAQGSGHTSNDKFDWRLDWNQNSKHRLFVRMSDRVREEQTPPCYFCNGADPNFGNSDVGAQVVVNDTITPSPTWVINTYVGFGRWREARTPVGAGQASAATIGLPTSVFQATSLPTIGADNYSGLGNGTYDRYVRYSDTAQANITKIVGRHTLKFGGNFDLVMINNEPFSVGSVNFSSSMTSCDPAEGGACQALNYGSNLTGDAIASMLLGTGSVNQSTNIDPAMSMHVFGGYFEDQWRATSRLTITAGLRYENQRPATERYNRLVYFDSQAASPISSQVEGALGRPLKGAFEYASSSNRFAWAPQNKSFAPRLGIAYKVTDKLVARAGAGIFFTPASAMLSFDGGQFLGYGSSTTYFGTQNGLGYIPEGSITDPFPNGLTPQQGSSGGASTYIGLGASQIWPKNSKQVGYTEQWSFDLQYQLGSHSIVEAGYNGVRGRRLMYGNPNLDGNQLPTQYLSLGQGLLNQVANPFNGVITDPNSALSGPTVPQYQLLEPFPQYGLLQWTRSLPGARSQFDALNLKFNHAFDHGLSAIVTYQWSKAIDNGSEDLVGWSVGNMWRDSYNTMLDYNISTHDVPHSFAAAVVYDLPYGKGKHWGGTAPALLNYVAGDWQVSSTIRVASGLPLFQVYDNTWAYVLGQMGFPGPEVPDLVGNPKPAHQVPGNWINTDAFVQTSDQFRYGNAPQRTSALREAPTENVDLSVAKTFGTERLKVQFRGEALNLFNHPIFGGNYNMDVCLQCGTAGQVYGTRNDPRNIQLSLRAMF